MGKLTGKESGVRSPAISVSRRTSATPYTPRVEAAGVKAYTVYNHTLLATVFEDLESDYRHLLEHVQLWDVSCERQVEVNGPDALKLVQLSTPRDLGATEFGRCFYAPLVDREGGMMNDPVILPFSENCFWLSIADSDIALWLKGLACGLDLDISVRTPDVWPLAIQGPKSDDLAARVFGDGVRDLRFFRFAKFPFQGEELIVARSGWSRQSGFEVYLHIKELALPLWDALTEAGQDLNVRAGCPNLIERIEGGLLSYGNDMTSADTPFDCGLGKHCNLDGDFDFVGKEALRRRLKGDSRRRMCGLHLDCPREGFPALTSAWPVADAEGGVVGQATSACYSPRLKSCIALAMVSADLADGATLSVTLENGATAAGKVVPLPFSV